ncbi:ribose-phosphate pyrophosphokinase [Beutenbergia cavernae DSM 12333]|uniref:ribose-phosphate diphosphokinase n=1 Tax=Beutenbergia cavernae (strain ATCC BAA-8 / DSM 12333 / CCUG 43141 / JCM 11478 / NBRC 16432 / NCIMB 13614 / HKI 0122) TaxID=471853 RepID=C5BV22_BEUC1|nr:ribose-phosphate pyrophosphokinase [Beutenbergia cavernae]ACQ78396.1 ribose-phosphate pyrophosphokinase [Beutenbergia cavernae DSM 12333]
MRDIRVFAGQSGRAFAAEMCAGLGVPLSDSLLKRFANDCLEVQLLENCRERDVYLVQPIVAPTQENLMELLLMIDAAKGASARRITAVMPHFAYARSDKKDAPRISIGGRLVADLLETAGVDRVLTMTLHAPQVHAFFRVPTDQLHARRELAAHFAGADLSNTTVVSPDLGNAKSATAFARMLGTRVAAGAKERFDDNRVVITSLIGDVAGRDIIVLDDEIANGSTIRAIVDLLDDAGVSSIRVACTHGIFSNGALDRIAGDDRITEVVTTDTVPQRAQHPKLTVLGVAPAFADAVHRIHSGESVSALFDVRPEPADA